MCESYVSSNTFSISCSIFKIKWILNGNQIVLYIKKYVSFYRKTKSNHCFWIVKFCQTIHGRTNETHPLQVTFSNVYTVDDNTVYWGYVSIRQSWHWKKIDRFVLCFFCVDLCEFVLNNFDFVVKNGFKEAKKRAWFISQTSFIIGQPLTLPF